MQFKCNVAKFGPFSCFIVNQHGHWNFSKIKGIFSSGKYAATFKLLCLAK